MAHANAALSVVPAAAAAASLAPQLAAIAGELNARIFGQGEAIEMLILALASGQHGFLVGAPGEGKSYLADALAAHITGARLFKLVAYPTAGEDDFLGPYDLAALNASPSRVARATAGFATEAHLVFVDEAMRAGGHLRDLLLPVMNEREIQIGNTRVGLPLHTMLLASNTWPTEEADQAFFDRCSLRATIRQPSAAEMHQAMFAVRGTVQTTLSLAQLQALPGQVAAVTVPAAIADATALFMAELADLGLRASTRRWCVCVSVLKAAAYLRGAAQVGEDDFAALRFVLAASAEQTALVLRAAASRQPKWVGAALKARDDIAVTFTQWESALAAAKRTPLAANATGAARTEATAEEHKALEAAEAMAITLSRRLREVYHEINQIHQASIEQGRENAQVGRALAQVTTMGKAVRRHLNV